MSLTRVPLLLLFGLSTVGGSALVVRRASDVSTVGIPDGLDALCPKGYFPDGSICIKLRTAATSQAPETPEVRNSHHDKRGRLIAYDQIPRRADRPSDYDRYRYPIPPGMPGGRYVISGYDLDLPDARQRRGASLSHVGHGGVDLPQRKGTPILAIDLEHQEGPAEVLFVGWLFGKTVLTRHRIREGGKLREYVLLYGHLDEPDVNMAPGTKVREGDAIGTVGDTSSPELVHLHLEARRVREGVDTSRLVGAALIAESTSVVCDPRNVLPLARR